MKILMVSMNSIHFVRWTQQLENSGHEVFWFDILDGGKAKGLPWVHQFIGWKQKYPNFKGRYFIKNRLPFLHNILKPLIERNVAKEFKKTLIQLKPDIVHSFALQISCVPIIKTMENFGHIKWIYSSWGSDLFNLNSVKLNKEQVFRVLNRVDYLITDCLRDFHLAKKLNFKGVFLGCFPGGGGYNFNILDKYLVKPNLSRDLILIKGYQGDLGRSIEVIKAIELIKQKLNEYKIIVFSAEIEVVEYLNEIKLDNHLDITILKKETFLPQEYILELMGKALIYIGNSISDGIPNTLLEAVIMGAFPIQSNPGNASAEVIIHGENGFLIENPDDLNDIKNLISEAILNKKLISEAFDFNQRNVKPKYEMNKIKMGVLDAYNEIKF